MINTGKYNFLKEIFTHHGSPLPVGLGGVKDPDKVGDHYGGWSENPSKGTRGPFLPGTRVVEGEDEDPDTHHPQHVAQNVVLLLICISLSKITIPSCKHLNFRVPASKKFSILTDIKAKLFVLERRDAPLQFCCGKGNKQINTCGEAQYVHCARSTSAKLTRL